MRKLTLPQNPHKGLKIYCKTCRVYNPKCKHFDRQVYQVRVHVPGTKNETKCKNLISVNYNDAVAECVDFERELKSNGYEKTNIIQSDISTDYNIADAVVKYREYLSGESNFAHLKKNVTQGHIDESIRFCWKFIENLKTTKNLKFTRPKDIKTEDVSNFYKWTEENYKPRTINKCLIAVKAFFEFLIEIENIEMKNPFRKYVRKVPEKNIIESITEDEFKKIIEAIDTSNSISTLKRTGEEKDRYRPYLKDGFFLFMFTGGRREEVINLKWSDIYTLENGIQTFIVENLKVKRIKKNSKEYIKYFTINEDFKDFLEKLGWKKKMGTEEYILHPIRGKSTTNSIMDALSKGFSHYKDAAGITKNINLSSLRKTYLSWQNHVLGNNTGLISNHDINGNILKTHYIDPKIMTAIEISALNVRVFGHKK